VHQEESRGIILFDGTCAFCDRSVQFIARHDPAGYFRFGASQSARARDVLREFGLTHDMTRTIVLIERNQVYLRSEAALRIAARLDWPWRMAAWLLWVPPSIRDAGYAVVAAVRHRVAGTSNACEIPPPAIRERLI
jgi:predicted DCC family thiol-disulfide oxidoreductase YuxK